MLTRLPVAVKALSKCLPSTTALSTPSRSISSTYTSSRSTGIASISNRRSGGKKWAVTRNEEWLGAVIRADKWAFCSKFWQLCQVENRKKRQKLRAGWRLRRGFRWKVIAILLLSLFGLGCFWQVSEPVSSAANAQSPSTTLKVVLREYQQARPISGVKLEILSYGWQLEQGQPYAVIAEGETGSDGSVSFDTTRWPKNGYRFRFSPTDHTRPEGLYFMSQEYNQYRGYPGNTIEGSAFAQQGLPLQSLYFVLLTTGLIENDLSEGQGRPQYREVAPEVGLGYYANFTPVEGKSFVATEVAATALSRAQGTPDPTMPLPPPPYTPGVRQQALAEGQGNGAADRTEGSAITKNAPSTSAGTAASNANASGIIAPAGGNKAPNLTNPKEPDGWQRVGQTLLALLGLVFLALFIRYRHWLFRLSGISGISAHSAPPVRTRRKRLAKSLGFVKRRTGITNKSRSDVPLEERVEGLAKANIDKANKEEESDAEKEV